MSKGRIGLALRRARGQARARPTVVPGPTHRNPKALAAELRELAAHPRAGSHSAALRELADAVAGGSGLEVWAGGGLVAAYGGPDALAPGPDKDAARGRRLGVLPTVLVFVPLLVTWFGLGAAAWAYQRMRDAGSTAQGSFLTLWQQGFDGQLWPVLRFDMMAVWTVLALSALATATMMRHRWEERDESERRLLSQRLSGALAQTQALAAGAAAASPGRFTAELQAAAERLRDLLGQAATVQQSARNLVVKADSAAGRSAAATAALDSAAEALRSGSTQIRTAVQSASAAAGEVSAGSRLLAESVGAAVTALRTSVTESFVTAGRDAAQLIGAAGESVASRFDTVAAAAEEREYSVAGHAAESMDRVGQEVREALTAARGSFAESTQLLGSAVHGLDRSLSTLPASLEASASEGAERIGMAYELAVAALVTSLRQEVRTVSAELADRIEELRDAVADRQTKQQYEAQLGSAVAEFHDTLRTLTKALREAGLAVTDVARRPDARPAAGTATPGPRRNDPPGVAPYAHGTAGTSQNRNNPPDARPGAYTTDAPDQDRNDPPGVGLFTHGTGDPHPSRNDPPGTDRNAHGTSGATQDRNNPPRPRQGAPGAGGPGRDRNDPPGVGLFTHDTGDPHRSRNDPPGTDRDTRGTAGAAQDRNDPPDPRTGGTGTGGTGTGGTGTGGTGAGGTGTDRGGSPGRGLERDGARGGDDGEGVR
ncbi:hypothetical protein AB0B78_16665 [Streptomyces sp. NPDC040724]|uniref:hypothetical protein n=1 Tax=Streptomyces sp. NPDC040724 TaxID=3155612 RepID=UPI0033F8C26C